MIVSFYISIFLFEFIFRSITIQLIPLLCIPKFFHLTMILQIMQKYSVTFIKINSWKDGRDVITGLDSGRRECLALNFRHVSFLQVRKNNRCQADIHVYTVYINNQTRFHLAYNTCIFSTSSKLYM